jgi:putative methyltransferase (TIGR04325 family)
VKRRGLSILKEWLPPALIRSLRHGLGRDNRFSGNFSSWQAALAATHGYDDRLIFNRVVDAARDVVRGDAVYERDSVRFDRIVYAWPLLAGLMWIAAQSGGRLDIIDFGGSLGTTYFQNRKFLNTLKAISWCIVEQPHFVEAGKKEFEDGNLKFYPDINTCLAENAPRAILFSSVLQYLEDPYRVLEEVRAVGFDYVLVDRTSFVLEGPDRLTVQRVPPTIYRASYPCWFFNRDRFLAFLGKDYESVAEFDALAGLSLIDHRPAGVDRGFIFRKTSRERKTESSTAP